MALTDGFSTGQGLGPRLRRRPTPGERVRCPPDTRPAGRSCAWPHGADRARSACASTIPPASRPPAAPPSSSPTTSASTSSARGEVGDRRHRARHQPRPPRRRRRDHPARRTGPIPPTRRSTRSPADRGPGIANLAPRPRRRVLHRRRRRQRPRRDRPPVGDVDLQIATGPGAVVRRPARRRRRPRSTASRWRWRGRRPAATPGARSPTRRLDHDPARRRPRPRRRRGDRPPTRPCASCGPGWTPTALLDPHARRAARHPRRRRRDRAAGTGATGALQYAGIGNIAATIVDGAARRARSSRCRASSATACSAPRTFDYELPPGALLVMHSDGLRSGWDLSAYPGVHAARPARDRVAAHPRLRARARRRQRRGGAAHEPADRRRGRARRPAPRRGRR